MDDYIKVEMKHSEGGTILYWVDTHTWEIETIGKTNEHISHDPNDIVAIAKALVKGNSEIPIPNYYKADTISLETDKRKVSYPGSDNIEKLRSTPKGRKAIIADACKTWAKRDDWYSLTLEEFLENFFGTYADGSLKVPKPTFYYHLRKLKERGDVYIDEKGRYRLKDEI
jgi:hypothetical protein